jgi:hydroxymethylpyrimidine pyrophosphatase-like HAD family hydrolase
MNGRPQNAYVFDVDGVLTDPQKKRVIHDTLFTRMTELLNRCEPIALNTGRSTTWVQERILNPLLDVLPVRSLLANFFIICEKGGTWITFEQAGNMTHGRDESLTVPEALKSAVSKLIEAKYADSMFVDPTKETMISTEMRDGFDIAEYSRQQEQLLVDVSRVLAETGNEGSYKIDPTTIATDIERPNVGKALGAARLLQFLEERDIEPRHFIAFGDSRSDFEMADELARQEKSIELVFVGDRAKLGTVAKDYPIIYIPGFSQGTLVYLNK